MLFAPFLKKEVFTLRVINIEETEIRISKNFKAWELFRSRAEKLNSHSVYILDSVKLPGYNLNLHFRFEGKEGDLFCFREINGGWRISLSPAQLLSTGFREVSS